MMRLQNEAVYPTAFEAIHVPVLMLHGSEDPHPGPMIRDNLKIYLPQLEYHEWQRCGHYPWLEKSAEENFYAVLLERLM
jgi:pimeloyl-ACP methyl ester carboxylesterase